MACFHGKDNTDLKLLYGVANLNTLIRYESTYDLMIEKLTKWANAFIDRKMDKEAIIVLEETVKIGPHLNKNYDLLILLYKKTF